MEEELDQKAFCFEDLDDVEFEQDSDALEDELEESDIVLMFGERECRLSSRDAQRLSIGDCRKKVGLDSKHRIRAEGAFRELPDESLISDLVKENQTKFNTSPRTDIQAVCMICQDPFTENCAVVTNHSCGHQLHSKCAAKAFAYSTRCPCCRGHWKDYDEYCPEKGLLIKTIPTERELRVDGDIPFLPESVDVPSDVSESPIAALPSARALSARNRRRALPRSYAETVINLSPDDRRDPGRVDSLRGRVDSLRNLGRSFQFHESILELADDSFSFDDSDDTFFDSDSGLDIEDQAISCHSCNQEVTNMETALTCRICQRQELR